MHLYLIYDTLINNVAAKIGQRFENKLYDLIQIKQNEFML